jgi:catechol 2,3-dioxygenase-like lactoylglutathione lyase family enzyme
MLSAMPGSPIPNVIAQVFIPVRNMPAAISWYAALLGLDVSSPTHGGTICDIPTTDGGPGLALDATQPDFSTDGPPRFFWLIDNLAAARAHLTSLTIPIDLEQNIGSVSFIQFRDPDGNRLMVCARN